MAVVSKLPPRPSQCRGETVAKQLDRKGKYLGPALKNPALPTRTLHKPALSPVYKRSQAEPFGGSLQRTFLYSVPPPLCSSISLIKSVWKFLWCSCGRQLDRHKQSKDNKSVTGHQGRTRGHLTMGKTFRASTGDSVVNQDLAPKAPSPPLECAQWQLGSSPDLAPSPLARGSSWGRPYP